jgi:hypothetical protein
MDWPLPWEANKDQVVLMKLPAILIGLLLSVTFVQSSYAMIRIEDDKGGSLGTYLLTFTAVRDSGERVMIDGTCSSACTLVTALIPRERICITERAMLGFHASWFEEETGNRVISAEGTRLLYEMYPPIIQKWIAHHGGLGSRMIVLKGRDLAAVYRFCQ